MALPDYFKLEHGTALIFGENGGSGVTNAIAWDALANGSGRMSASFDLGAQWDQEWAFWATVETGTAPAAGAIVEYYIAWSYNGTVWPGKVTGSEAAYPTTVADNKKQLGTPVHVLVATADANTAITQNVRRFFPPARYGVLVPINLLGQAFRDQATASNNLSRAYMVPSRFLQQDAA